MACIMFSRFRETQELFGEPPDIAEAKMRRGDAHQAGRQDTRLFDGTYRIGGRPVRATSHLEIEVRRDGRNDTLGHQTGAGCVQVRKGATLGPCRRWVVPEDHYAVPTAAMMSISTGAPRGSSATPTDVRAWRPLLPRCATKTSEAPFMTCDCCTNPGAEAT